MCTEAELVDLPPTVARCFRGVLRDGQPNGSAFAPDCSCDDGESAPVPRPWQGGYLSSATREGMPAPGGAVVERIFSGRPFAGWRARPSAVEFECASTPAERGGVSVR